LDLTHTVNLIGNRDCFAQVFGVLQSLYYLQLFSMGESETGRKIPYNFKPEDRSTQSKKSKTK
jgi:hypothetical protein